MPDGIDTVLRGLGQVMFMNNPVTGVAVLVALFVAEPRLALGALLAAYGVSVVEPATPSAPALPSAVVEPGPGDPVALAGGVLRGVGPGLWSYNAVLCAAAVGGVFVVLTWRSALLAWLARSADHWPCPPARMGTMTGGTDAKASAPGAPVTCTVASGAGLPRP